MKSLFTLLTVFVFSTAGMAAGSAVPDYPADKISEHTYVIHGPMELPNPKNRGFMNNPAFILTPGGVVVIDPGSSVQAGEMVLRQIARVTRDPVIAVFDSHIHGDHWLGNQAIREKYPQAKIYAHKTMIEMVEQGEGNTWLDIMHRMTEGATEGTRVVKPDTALSGRQSLTLGGHRFDIIHLGKAHTATDIMVHYREDDVLFTGDNAGNRRILRVDHGSFKGNIDTLQAAIDLKPKHVVPGHGQTGGVDILQAYQTYLATIYREVQKGYDEDLSDFEMKPKIHAALKDYHDWPGYEDELGKHISETYLEIESAGF